MVKKNIFFLKYDLKGTFSNKLHFYLFNIEKFYFFYKFIDSKFQKIEQLY